MKKSYLIVIGSLYLLGLAYLAFPADKNSLPLIEEAVAEAFVIDEPDVRLPNAGAVAYVSPDGCQVVWEPQGASGKWAHCAVVQWGKAIQHTVPAGVDFAAISREWDEVYAPENWL